MEITNSIFTYSDIYYLNFIIERKSSINQFHLKVAKYALMALKPLQINLDVVETP